MRSGLSIRAFFAAGFWLLLCVLASIPLTLQAQTPSDTGLFGERPAAPAVASPTYPDESAWYNTTTGHFTWETPAGVVRVAAEVATSTEGEPIDTFPANTESLYVSADDLQNGLQYVAVQFRNAAGWGDITFRPLQIDTIPPQPFLIKVEQAQADNAFPVVTFEATDTLSGIDYYEVYVPHQQKQTLTPDEAAAGYELRGLEDNIYVIQVTAYDKAGNERKSSIPVTVTAGWTADGDAGSGSLLLDFFTDENAVILILTLVVLGQFLYILYEKQELKKEEAMIRQETEEVQEQMVKIFGALRNEIHDQIQAITSKSKLSKGEQEAVDGLNQAIKVSETLIKKEIKDVKNILK